MLINLLQFLSLNLETMTFFRQLLPSGSLKIIIRMKKVGDLFFVWTEIDRKSFLTKIAEEKTF